MPTTGYATILTLVVVAATASGCGASSADELAADFDQVQTGATLAEVERVLGAGEEISQEQLPPSFARVYPLQPSWTFRRWVRQANQEKATMFAALHNNTLTSARLIEKESITTGPAAR